MMGDFMNKVRKIILGLTIMFTMLGAMVFGIGALNHDKPIETGTIAKAETDNTEKSKPLTYTYAPNQVEIVKGGGTLRFDYQPDALLKDSPKVKAFEYIFGSSMDEPMAINLKYINTTDVEVSYVYSTSRLNTTESITGETTFTTQTIANKGDNIYIYILVSPTKEDIPANFTQEIEWWFGLPGTLSVTNPLTGDTITQTIVKGQPVDVDLVKDLLDIEGEIQWFYDEACTEQAPADLKIQSRPLYIKIGTSANLPSDWLTLDGNHYVVTKGTSELPSELVIPSYYEGLPVTHIADADMNASSEEEMMASMVFGQSEITSVTLPETLKHIGIASFALCPNLTTLVIPASVTSIGMSAFYGSAFTSITITDMSDWMLEADGDMMSLDEVITAMQEYEGIDLTDPTIMAQMLIGEGGFASWFKPEPFPTDWLVYDSVTLSYHVTKGTSSLPAFAMIPSTYNDGTNGELNVTHIDDNTFANSTSRIILPSTLTTIGANAFNGSTISSITFPTSIASIGANAFMNCANLTEINLNGCSQLTSIDGCFDGNYVTYISLDSTGITNLDLSNFTKLASLNVSNTNITTVDLSGCASLTSIPSFGKGLTSINLSGCTGLTGIGQGPFYECGLLTSIDLSGCTNLTSIGTHAFNNCIGLTSVILPSSLTKMGEYAFYKCSGLTSIDLSGCTGLTSIGNGVFSGCSGLTSIILPSSITSIGVTAFSNCYALSEVYNLSSINITIGSTDNGYIGRYAKVIHTSLDAESRIQTIDNVHYYVYGTDFIAIGPTSRYTITSVTLDSRTTSISDNTFNGCYALAEVYNLSSLTITNGSTSNGYVGYYAKVIHTNLDENSRIQAINNIQYYVYENDFIALAPTNRNITSATLDSRTTEINQYVFYNCKRLTSIDLSGCTSLTNIGDRAFYGCSKLTSADLNQCNSLTTIGNSAFNDCIGLTSITLPGSLTSIGDYAFETCRGLTSVVIPASVTSIGTYVFRYCGGLESIVVESGNTAYDSRNNCNALIETSTNTLIQGCNNTIIPNGITTIGSGAFHDCSGLTSIVIPASVTSMGSSAFANTGLTSITLSSGLTSIGSAAFAWCSGLTDVYYDGLESDFANITIGDSNTYFTNATIHYAYGWDVEVITEPTCTSTGLTRYTKGDRTWDVVTDKIPHNYVNKVCTMCGKQVSVELAISSSGTYGFDEASGVYTSNNKGIDSSTATSTITIQGEGQIQLIWTISSESGCDKLLITHNGTSLTNVNNVSGTKNGTETITVANGDTIVITYTKDGSSASGTDIATFQVVIE